MKLFLSLLQIVALMVFSSASCVADQRSSLDQASHAQIKLSGTCFFVDGFGTAVTNHHVVAGAEKIVVLAAGGSSSPAIITKVSENLDLALLSTGLQTPHFLSLAPIL